MGSLDSNARTNTSASCQGTGVEPIKPLASSAFQALKLAVNFSLEGVNHDGHWCGELR